MSEIPTTSVEANHANSTHIQERGFVLAESLQELSAKAGPMSRELFFASNSLLDTDNPKRFDTAQREMERSSEWSDDSRNLAVEINRANLDAKGLQPISEKDALGVLKDHADRAINDDWSADEVNGALLTAQSITTLQGDIDIGLKAMAVDTLLGLVEQDLAAYEQQRLTGRSETVTQLVEETRGIRDVLVLKQRTIEAEMNQATRTVAEQQERDQRVSASRTKLDKLFGDKSDEATSVEADQPIFVIPTDRRGQFVYERDVLGDISREALSDIVLAGQKKVELKAFILAKIDLISETVEGGKVPDTIAGVLGNSGAAAELVHLFLNQQQITAGGEAAKYDNAFFGQSLPSVAKSLGLDVAKERPDFYKSFSRAEERIR